VDLCGRWSGISRALRSLPSHWYGVAHAAGDITKHCAGPEVANRSAWTPTCAPTPGAIISTAGKETGSAAEMSVSAPAPTALTESAPTSTPHRDSGLTPIVC
jgi:hypothetical protein